MPVGSGQWAVEEAIGCHWSYPISGASAVGRHWSYSTSGIQCPTSLPIAYFLTAHCPRPTGIHPSGPYEATRPGIVV